MVRGRRTTAPKGLILGHEITGEIIEKGKDVEMLKDRRTRHSAFQHRLRTCCRNCREGKTGICLTVNPARPGAAYGYVDMGGWVGGQAEYVMVPYADFNLIKFPDKERAMAKIKDLTLLSDIFLDRLPRLLCKREIVATRALSAFRSAGAGSRGPGGGGWAPVVLGAAVVIVGDMIPERLAQAKSFGCEVIDVSKITNLGEAIAQIVGEPVVDCAVDCVGFEARGHGSGASKEAPATVLNSLQEVVRAGGSIGIRVCM